MTVDQLIADVNALASRQHGLIRTDQIPTSQQNRLRHLARRGMVSRVAKGVYRVSGAPRTWHQDLQAGVWSLGPTCVVSRRAAARLHGFDGFDLDAVEFTIGRECRGRRPAGIPCTVHTMIDPRAGDRVTVDGLPTTSTIRTIIDLARDGASVVELEAAVDSAIRSRAATLDAILERLAAMRGPGRWGLGRLYSVLTSSGGHTMLERRFIELVQRARLPAPTPQVVHRLDGRHVARVDFAFVGHGVVVEVSGGRGHSSPRERAKDARRRNDLQRLGQMVLEFTFEQVIHDPAMVVSVLRSTLAGRAMYPSA
jgi:hypothetical protein